jgi:hypothetical protein
MDQQQVRWALFKISVVALAGCSWIFTSFVFATRPEEQLIAGEPGDALVSLVRLPASLPAVPAQLPKLLVPDAKPFEPIQMNVLKLPCWDTGAMKEQAVNARWVRLTGRACQTSVGAEAIEIRNESNGYTGTVFTAQQNLLTTDFIPLQKGANEIVVRIGEADGVALENRFVLVKSGE